MFKNNIYKEISNANVKKLIYYNISGSPFLFFLSQIGSSSMASACGGSLALMDAGKDYVSKLLVFYIYIH